MRYTPPPMHKLTGPLCATMLILGLAACGTRPVLSGVSVEPDQITPNQDGDADVARIRYAIGSPVALTITLVAEDGTTYVLRDGKPRVASATPYEALFGGVVDGRMLPDGAYRVRITAQRVPVVDHTVVKTDGNAAVAPDTLVPEDPSTVELPLTIRGGDSTPILLEGFGVEPPVFTPNQDGRGDRVTVSYALREPAAKVRIVLKKPDGSYVTDLLEEKGSASEPGAIGAHQYDYDAGVDADAPPPPNGEYVVEAEATDAAGNVSRATAPLTIRDGGQPRAAIFGDVDWSATILPLGATLDFTATVQNVGDTPIRTRGPEPGFVYENESTYNRFLPPGFLILARTPGGAPRSTSVHVLLDGAAGSSVTAVDARTTGTTESTSATIAAGSIGATRTVDLDIALGPVEGGTIATTALGASDAATASLSAADQSASEASVALCGTVRDGDRPVSGALVYAFQIDGDDGVQAVADSTGHYCFPSLRVPPPLERTLAQSSGAIRLGLEYDEKLTDLPYPARWQLGRTGELDVCSSESGLYLCLPPGATVQIHGGVRFATPPARRSTNVYLALMHEDVRRMHGPYGLHRITVEYER